MLEGDIIHWKMPFSANTSEKVAIEIVSACSCFEIDWPRDTFKIGQKGEITGIFYSANQEGPHVKTVDVILRNEDEKGYPVIKQFQVKMFVAQTQVELENWQKPKILPNPPKKGPVSTKKTTKSRQPANRKKN
jgi:Protein of unknown function (DUF1573)